MIRGLEYRGRIKGLKQLFILLGVLCCRIVLGIDATISCEYPVVSEGYPVVVTAAVSEAYSEVYWYWGDGVVTESELSTRHTYITTGDYSILFFAVAINNTDAVILHTNVTVVEQEVHYVALNGSGQAPYSSWETASPVIQDAVDATGPIPGALILVTNGCYNQGGRLRSEQSITNRVLLDKPVILQSVNGSDVTIIQGSTTNSSDFDVGGVYIDCVSLLTGFTIKDCVGVGISCAAGNSIVSNCVIVSNYSGGVCGGTIYDCLIKENTYVGYCGCGGVSDSTLYNCIIQSNYSSGFGAGGAKNCVLYNCQIIHNSASYIGGASGCIFHDCFAFGNIQEAFGNYKPIFNDCTVYFNEEEYVSRNDYHLTSFSPCINRGNNAYTVSVTDFEGKQRTQGGIVDIGAYEYQWDRLDVAADWLAHYGLATNGISDDEDSDGDGLSNRQEWMCHTDPTDSTSSLNLMPPGVTAVTSDQTTLTLQWVSQPGVSYRLLRSCSFDDEFTVIATGIVENDGMARYTDIINEEQAYYRIEVE